jgi:hypothetical protein
LNEYYTLGEETIPNLAAGTNGDLAMQTTGNAQFIFPYYVPATLNGIWYMVLMVDGDDTNQENNEMNNIFYFLKSYYNGYANRDNGTENSKLFRNDLEPNFSNLISNKYHTALRADNLNTYTPEEVKFFFHKEKENGNLQKSLNRYRMLKEFIQKENPPKKK